MTEELLSTEFECSLCMKILYQPVTIYCGHTFCRSCLVRTLDHSTKCPLCRQVVHIDANAAPTNVVLQSILEKRLYLLTTMIPPLASSSNQIAPLYFF